MRWLLMAATLFVLAGNSSHAEEPSERQAIPTADTIIDLCGGDLKKMFSKVGAPKYMVVARGDTNEEDDILCEYGDFILRVHENTVQNCFFPSNWRGSIKGIQMGDSREAVIKALGKPQKVAKDKEGVETSYGYDLKDRRATLWANFNDEGNVRRVEIELVE